MPLIARINIRTTKVKVTVKVPRTKDILRRAVSGRIAELAAQTRGMLVVEMNAGQMVDDVRLAVNGAVPVKFYGRMGGAVPFPEEVVTALTDMHLKMVQPEESMRWPS